MIGVGTRFSDFTTASKWIFQHPEVRFLNINVSNFDAWKLDGIAMLADAREAMTALDAALADSGWQAGWGAQIESVQSRQLKETQRVYQAVWQEKSFVPEIDDHLDRESVYREFRQITDSTLTQSSVLGVLNENAAGRGGDRRGGGAACQAICSASGATARKTPTTWSTATPAWDTKSTRRWA
ncbi:Epi-inositol hydrolase [Klebsiella variicola]|nr:Epi-inositol hydrolase [Klebsiella variicola]